MPAPIPPTGPRVIRHDYIHGGDAVFSVESTLFRVHRFFFIRDSLWFRDRLPYPPPPGETTEGSSDKRPLVLEGVSKKDFDRLLWVFYNPKYSLYDASIEEWTSILKLAVQWDFIEVKELAVRSLETHQIPALQKVVLYQTYGVDRNLLQAALTALTVRDAPLTIEEGQELGLETALHIACARETARAPRRAGNPRSPVNLVGAELDTLINDIFQLSSPGAAHENTTDTSQMPTNSGTGTQTNAGPPPSNIAPGTGGPANGSVNGPTNGPPNSPHVNGTTPNHSQNNTSRTNGRFGGQR